MRFAVMGLGNPGPFFANTRHNIGQAVVEMIAQQNGLVFEGDTIVRSAQFPSSHPLYGGHLLCVPLMGINVSGEAIENIPLAFQAKDLVVVYDDMSLPFGEIRIKPGSSENHGGHNGIKSVIEKHGPDFVRVKIGIGAPTAEQTKLQHALSPFTPEELANLGDVLAQAIFCIEDGLRMVEFRGKSVSAIKP